MSCKKDLLETKNTKILTKKKKKKSWPRIENQHYFHA